MTPRRRRLVAEVLLWLVPAIWSSNYLIARAAATQVPPHLLAYGRWLIVVILLLAWRGPEIWRRREVVRREAGRLFVLGALGMWICGAWVYLGGRTTSATNIGLIYAIAPIGIAVGGAWLLRERLATRQVFAMACALLGVLIVVSRGDLAAAARLHFVVGDLWILGATASWIAYSLLLRQWKTDLSAVDRLCASAFAGLLILAPFAASEWCSGGPVAPQAYLWILMAGLLPGLASYLAYSFMQTELGVARAALVMYLAPIYAAALAWIFLHEQPHWFHLLGAALIVPGIRYSAPSSAAPTT